MKKNLLIVLIALSIPSLLVAQTNIYYVNSNGSVGNETTIAGNTQVSSVVTPGALSRGAGLRLWGAPTGIAAFEGGITLANGFTSTTAIYDAGDTNYAADSTQAVTNNQYFEFSFTVGSLATDEDLDLTTLRAKLRRSGAGSINYMWKYAMNGGGYNFISNIVTLPSAASTTNGVQQSDIDLSSVTRLQNLPSGTIVSFRIYHWGATSQTGTFAIGRSLSTTEHSIQILGVATLPVSLTSFTAKANKAGKVDLAWATASEENNSHFEITRSTDGENFGKIGGEAGNGNSSTVKNYNYTDNSPVAGTNYYQLKQVDFDGKSALSKVVSAKVGLNQNNIKVSANKTNITVNYNAAANGKATFTVYSVSGAKLTSVQQSVNAGGNQFNIPVQLGNSLHLLKVEQSGESVSVKF